MKKLLILLLCAAMLLSCFLTGCNNTPDTPADGTDAVTTAEDTTVRETEPADTEESAETTAVETTVETEAETDPEENTENMPEIGITRSISSVTIRAGDSPAEGYAATELTKYLEKKGVTVGDSGYTVTLSVDDAMVDDSYSIAVYRKNGDGTVITGGNGRGVIYGVYRFLEEFGGVRFFTPTLESVPAGNLEITTGLLQYDPIFENRHTDWSCMRHETEWMVKNGINCSIYAGISEEMGSQWNYGSQFVHNICAVTNTDANAQPCLTDPAVLEYAIQYVRKRLESEPNTNIITVSQMDNQNYCRCENCAVVDDEEGSPSGTLLRFVNAIANDIAEDYPDVIIDTLAYLYTRRAPKITKPAPNVCIRLCSIECCFVHPLDDPSCPLNVSFAKDLEDWSRICERIYIWDYSFNFCHYIPTFPNLTVIRENMQYFAEHNVKGMFPQGMGVSPSGEFGELRCYLLAKLMQNPLMTEEEYETHMNEFLAAYYGEGWRGIRSYIDLTTALASTDCQNALNHPQHSVVLKLYPLVEDNFNEWWDTAEALAGDKLANVQRSRLQWRYIELMIHPDREKSQQFIADVQAWGIHWGDGTGIEVPERADLTLGPEYWFVRGYWLPES